MPTREDLEDIMNNKPYGFGRKLITKKLNKYSVETVFTFSPKNQIRIKDEVMASNTSDACFPGDYLVNAKQKRKELEEKYPELWVNEAKYATKLL